MKEKHVSIFVLSFLALIIVRTLAGCGEAGAGDEGKTLAVEGVFTLSDLALNTNSWGEKTYIPAYHLILPENAETVQTVTNVVNEFGRTRVFSNTVLVDDMGNIIYDYAPDGTKTATTTIKRIFTLKEIYHGKDRTLTHEEIVSVTVKKYRKNEKWEEVKHGTDDRK